MATAMVTFLVRTFVDYDNTSNEDALDEEIDGAIDVLENEGFQDITVEDVTTLDVKNG